MLAVATGGATVFAVTSGEVLGLCGGFFVVMAFL